MSDFVLDASATLALYLPASQTQRDYASDVLRLMRAGAVPAVPGLWAMEVGAVLLKCRRRRQITAAQFAVALAELDALDYEVHHLPYTVPGLVAAAKTYMLTGYDAVYFDLAKQLGVPLASLDRGHKSACKAHGVKLLAF